MANAFIYALSQPSLHTDTHNKRALREENDFQFMKKKFIEKSSSHLHVDENVERVNIIIFKLQLMKNAKMKDEKFSYLCVDEDFRVNFIMSEKMLENRQKCK